MQSMPVFLKEAGPGGGRGGGRPSGGGGAFSLSQNGGDENDGSKSCPCIKCDKEVVDGAIMCGMCERWAHFQCIDLNKTNAGKLKNILNIENLVYMCDACTELFNAMKIGLQSICNSQNDMKKMVHAANEYMIEVACHEGNVDEIKTNSYADALKKDLDQMKKDMCEMKNKMIEKVNTVEDVMLETRERDRRKTNLILHQVVECDDDAKRKDEDASTVKKILGELGFEGTKVHRCFRLGPKRTDGKNRLMLVDVGSQDVRDGILRRAPNLKQNSDFSRIFIRIK